MAKEEKMRFSFYFLKLKTGHDEVQGLMRLSFEAIQMHSRFLFLGEIKFRFKTPSELRKFDKIELSVCLQTPDYPIRAQIFA